MKHLIYTDLETAQARNELAFMDGNAAGMFVPGTAAYAGLRPHPDGGKWALPIDPRYAALFTAHEHETAAPLGPEWFSQPEQPE